MLVPHFLKIYFGLGWPSSVLEIVSVTKIKNKQTIICFFGTSCLMKFPGSSGVDSDLIERREINFNPSPLLIHSIHILNFNPYLILAQFSNRVYQWLTLSWLGLVAKVPPPFLSFIWILILILFSTTSVYHLF